MNGQPFDLYSGDPTSTARVFVHDQLNGVGIKSQLRFGALKTDSAMAQLLQYNCFSKYKVGLTKYRFSKEHEIPFPVFIGIVCLWQNSEESSYRTTSQPWNKCPI